MSESARLPVSVIVVTKNEEARLGACLEALQDFDQIIVVDSNSADKTPEIAKSAGAEYVNFTWDGRYPKKRGWCLAHLNIKHDFVFFVDADEIVSPALREELHGCPFTAAGYFVRGQYLWNGKALKHGLRNNKIVLFNRHKMEFPVVDDLSAPGMGEIEGHYQPVWKDGQSGVIGALQSPLLHDAGAGWTARHERYAAWENYMNRKNAWPCDPVAWRQKAKEFLRVFPWRPAIALLHSYVLKFGFLDGAAGLGFRMQTPGLLFDD